MRFIAIGRAGLIKMDLVAFLKKVIGGLRAGQTASDYDGLPHLLILRIFASLLAVEPFVVAATREIGAA